MNIAAIEPDRIQTRYQEDGAPAWLATIKRIYSRDSLGLSPRALVAQAF
jgi:hypothetical protein